MVDVERPAHVLGPVLAAVDESIVDLQLRYVAHRTRHGNSPALHALNALGKVDAIAEYVVALFIDDDLAKMHPMRNISAGPRPASR